MSNAERQRRFRERHPGYDRRRKATERARAEREGARILAAIRLAMAQQTQAAVAVTPQTPSERLMLPAPTIDPAITAIDALGAALAARRAREIVVER